MSIAQILPLATASALAAATCPAAPLAVPFDSDASDPVGGAVDVLQVGLAALIGFAIGAILMMAIQGIVRYLLRNHVHARDVIRPAGRPLQLALGALGAWLGASFILRSNRPDWYAGAFHGFIIIEIIALTWFIAAAVGGIEEVILESVREGGQSRYRKVQTQMQILQRVITVVIWLCGFAAVLLTFPAARTVGTSLLASAGIVSVIAGIAAQSTLGNVFAGLQLAFSDSIRVGDVLNWEGQRCNVEEITLTYVVLRVWDGRRLIVPSQKMTTQTFENWTRRSPELMAHVDFRLDWSAPIEPIRAHLMELLAATDLWDGRVGVLQVRDTDGEAIQVSALVSARNSSTMTDLRNYLREEMVNWLQAEYPDALPHTRYFNYNFEGEAPAGPGATAAQASGSGESTAHGGGHGTASAGATAPSLRAQNAGAAGTASSAASPAQAARPDGQILPPDAAPRDLEETTVLSLEDIGLDESQPERVPIAQRDAGSASGAPTASRSGHASSVFTGSLEAEARAEDFESAGAAAAAERSEAARRREENAARAREGDGGAEGVRAGEHARAGSESSPPEAAEVATGAAGEAGDSTGEASDAAGGAKNAE